MRPVTGSQPHVGHASRGRHPAAEPSVREPGVARREDVPAPEGASSGSRMEAARGRPPKDADPRLWALLTRAERDFYFRNATFGALTYGPAVRGSGPEPAGRRLGGQIDLTA